MATVEEFRASLAGADAYDVVDTFLLTDGAVHVGDDDIDYVSDCVGKKGEKPLPRYRLFSDISDIDIAVVGSRSWRYQQRGDCCSLS
jgi:hypothetical protein